MASTNLSAILKERQKQQRELAAQGAGVSQENIAGVASGMQSSSEKAAVLATTPPPVKGDVDKTLAEASLAVYEDNDRRPLRRVIRAKGGKNVAINGFFYAKDEEDVRLLEEYVVKGLVSKADPQDKLDV